MGTVLKVLVFVCSSLLCACVRQRGDAQMIYDASRQERIALIDRLYSEADSLASINANPDLLFEFCQKMADYFTDPASPLMNDSIYLACLDREALCDNLSPSDRRRVYWKREQLVKNAVGTQVCDFDLLGKNGGRIMLHDAIKKDAIIFIYGQTCSRCLKMMEDLNASSKIREALAVGEIQFISIYAGEDENEFVELSSRLLPGWESYMDRENVILYSQVFESRLIPSLYRISADLKVQIKGALEVNSVL